MRKLLILALAIAAVSCTLFSKEQKETQIEDIVFED